MKNVLILLEDGFEEIEALAPVDLLRRAGAHVTMATSNEDLQVTGKSGVTVLCNHTYNEISHQEYDLLILPGGGGGVDALCRSPFALEQIRKYFEQKKWVGAICAAPLVLKEAGVLQNHTITSYPSARKELESLSDYREERVVIDEFLIPSRGPGTAVEFALALIEKLYGPEMSRQIKEQVAG